MQWIWKTEYFFVIFILVRVFVWMGDGIAPCYALLFAMYAVRGYEVRAYVVHVYVFLLIFDVLSFEVQRATCSNGNSLKVRMLTLTTCTDCFELLSAFVHTPNPNHAHARHSSVHIRRSYIKYHRWCIIQNTK